MSLSTGSDSPFERPKVSGGYPLDRDEQQAIDEALRHVPEAVPEMDLPYALLLQSRNNCRAEANRLQGALSRLFAECLANDDVPYTEAMAQAKAALEGKD